MTLMKTPDIPIELLEVIVDDILVKVRHTIEVKMRSGEEFVYDSEQYDMLKSKTSPLPIKIFNLMNSTLVRNTILQSLLELESKNIKDMDVAKFFILPLVEACYIYQYVSERKNELKAIGEYTADTMPHGMVVDRVECDKLIILRDMLMIISTAKTVGMKLYSYLIPVVVSMKYLREYVTRGMYSYILYDDANTIEDYIYIVNSIYELYDQYLKVPDNRYDTRCIELATMFVELDNGFVNSNREYDEDFKYLRMLNTLYGFNPASSAYKPMVPVAK